MAIYVPKSQLNFIANEVAAAVRGVVVFSAGKAVSEEVYRQIKKHLDDERHDYHVGSGRPADYVLLADK